jgi:transposase
MKQKYDIIIKFFNNNESIRSIARSTSLHRETVKKYISEHEKELVELFKRKDNPTEKDICKIIEEPKYKQRITPKRKATPDIMNRINELLKINEENRKNGLYKQQLKMIDIHEDLKSQGYDIGYTTVCGLIKELSDKPKEAFIRQSYELGRDCEFDWGDVTLRINGEFKRYQLAVFASCASNFRYSRLFDKQDTASFQEAHAHFFQKVGGVFKRVVYDNMKVAVKKFIGSTEKEPTKGLLELAIYYHFAYRFCNVGKGNEKGHVERSVEVERRKVFSKKIDFESLASANEYLEKEEDKLNNKIPVGCAQSSSSTLEEEKKYLLPLPPFFSVSKVEQLKVDKYSTISFETNRYSIPDDHVGKCMTVRIYPTRLKISYNDKKLCEHERLSGQYDWQLNIDHYLRTLKRKPGALSGSLALKQMKAGNFTAQKLVKIYDKYYQESGKEFVELLQYIMEKEADCPRDLIIKEIEESLESLEPIKAGDILTDKIIIICEKNKDEKEASKNGVENVIDGIGKSSKKLLKEVSDFLGFSNAADEEKRHNNTEAA